MKVSLKKFVVFSAVLVCALGVVGEGDAGIVAGFDDGAGTTLVDQYTGVAGSGWTTAWSAPNATASVSSASQLNSGGNYLTVSTNSAGNGGVRRSYADFDGVDLTAEYVVSFDWRFDGDFTEFASGPDRLSIADGSAGGAGESPSNTFFIRAHGDDRGVANGKEWALYNGGQDGATDVDDDLWVNSGMSFADDVVYSFTVTVDPVNRTYDVTIDNGTTDVTVTDLGFWSSEFSGKGTLNFVNRKSSSADDLSYSIDSISIAVPEPASVALLGAGMLLIFSRGSKD